MLPPQQHPSQPGDGQVEGYQRVVNGKVVKVNAYGKSPSTSTRAAVAARKRPGRPQIAAQPGTYASGRDLPGVKAKALPPPPPPPQPFPQKKGGPPGGPPQQ
jgi:hypothetical protein